MGWLVESYGLVGVYTVEMAPFVFLCLLSMVFQNMNVNMANYHHTLPLACLQDRSLWFSLENSMLTTYVDFVWNFLSPGQLAPMSSSIMNWHQQKQNLFLVRQIYGKWRKYCLLVASVCSPLTLWPLVSQLKLQLTRFWTDFYQQYEILLYSWFKELTLAKHHQQ